MKKIAILLLANCVGWACSKNEPKKDLPVNPPKEEIKPEIQAPSVKKEEVIDFFSQSLEGKSNSFSKNQALTTTDIQASQKMVWEAWKQANQSLTEEKLADLTPLASVSAHRWKLPEHLEANATMPYYWASKGEQPSEGYPLFLYLHGSGDKESEWRTGKDLARIFDDAPSAYFIPQIPNTGEYYRWWQKAKQFAWEKLLRLSFLSGKINPNRVYFFGISEGGYGSQRLASFYADYLAGAGPMAGGEPLINAPVENCRNIAFSLRTGANDYMFHRDRLTQYTKESFEKFKAQDPEAFVHSIEIIPESGHHIGYTPTPRWLKQFTRNPHPKIVIWEDFPMDGIFRKGFYNLQIQERPAEEARQRYTMQVTDNKVVILVDNVTYQGVEKSPRWGFFTKYNKSFEKASGGKFVLYLNEQLVDFSKEVEVEVNGKKVFSGKVQPDIKHIVESCAVFFDPERLFPVAIEVAY